LAEVAPAVLAAFSILFLHILQLPETLMLSVFTDVCAKEKFIAKMLNNIAA
jgi:hypothetical protein